MEFDRYFRCHGCLNLLSNFTLIREKTKTSISEWGESKVSHAQILISLPSILVLLERTILDQLKKAGVEVKMPLIDIKEIIKFLVTTNLVPDLSFTGHADLKSTVKLENIKFEAEMINAGRVSARQLFSYFFNPSKTQ